MKTFSCIEPPVPEFEEMVLQRYGINPAEYLVHKHPQEDFVLVSKKYPIYVVADGVTLAQFLIEKKSYPQVSPSGDIARVFCEALMQAAEERYEQFTEKDILEVFKAGNAAAKMYNQKHGRTKETSDFWHNDLYAATAAFCVIKNDTVYWASIGDSFMSHFRAGQLIFKSPGLHDRVEVDTPPQFEGQKTDRKSRAMFNWSIRRNGLNADGKRIGYGVVTGEEAAEQYLNMGTFQVQAGDVVIALTDGFEKYLTLLEFVALINKNPETINPHLQALMQQKTREAPDTYGHERSLIIIQV